MDAISFTTSHSPDWKSTVLLLKVRDIFFKWKHNELRNKKVKCFEQDKGARSRAFIVTAASAPHLLCLY